MNAATIALEPTKHSPGAGIHAQFYANHCGSAATGRILCASVRLIAGAEFRSQRESAGQ